MSLFNSNLINILLFIIVIINNNYLEFLTATLSCTTFLQRCWYYWILHSFTLPLEKLFTILFFFSRHFSLFCKRYFVINQLIWLVGKEGLVRRWIELINCGNSSIIIYKQIRSECGQSGSWAIKQDPELGSQITLQTV